MKGVTLGDIRRWTTAEVVGSFDPSRELSGITTDSRRIKGRELFLALKGETFDGHDFVPHAFANGACAAVVSRRNEVCEIPRGAVLFKVDNPLHGLGLIAAQYRRWFEVPIVAVTGSTGKTTTKEMVAAVLSQCYSVLKTKGSENNEIGVPLTLLQLDRGHQAVVVELAARKRGDIRYLCEIANPTVGVLLNIGSAHLEFFGSVEGVAEAKGELLDYLGESSVTLINGDDCVVVREAKRTKGRLLSFSLDRESCFRGEGLVLDQEGRGHFSLRDISFNLQAPGRHNVYNALAAIAVGDVFGVPWPARRLALASFQSVPRRSDCLRKNGIRVINDSYNANPDSVKAALELLDVLAARESGRRIAVLGDMLELGEFAEDLHAAVGRSCAEGGIDYLFTTGALGFTIASGARSARMPARRVRHFDNKDSLSSHLGSVLQPRDVVLVKASRGMGLWEVADHIG